ncbi:MAG: hypothetical protein HW421_2568 [Ignavibacteria bacterium]|nr:hypothetical protein [Ignavibacteria bacterium]
MPYILRDAADYFRTQIDLLENEEIPLRRRILSARSILSELFENLTKDEPRYFTSLFSRINFIIDKFHIPHNISLSIQNLRRFFAKVNQNAAFEIHSEDIEKTIMKLRLLLDYLEKPDEFTNEPELLKTGDLVDNIDIIPPKKDIITFLSVNVKSKLDFKHPSGNKKASADLELEVEEIGKFRLRLFGFWIDIWKMAWAGANLNLINIKLSENDPDLYLTTFETLIIIEPDYLIDVTDIAECFSGSKANVKIYFFRKFLAKPATYSMFLGNLVNFFFDELLINKSADFDVIYSKALQVKPLQLFAVAVKNPELVKNMKNEIQSHYDRLKEIIEGISWDFVNIEPSFISPVYGLQGRLDAMLEYRNEPERKNIIELKSGNAPNVQYRVTNIDGNEINTGIWQNNFMQIVCYDLLLDSTYPNRTGNSQILYSKSADYPLRNAPDSYYSKAEALLCRNWVITLIYTFIQGKFSLLNTINPVEFGTISSFMKNDVEEFASVYSKISELEQEYFHFFISFILRELNEEKTGIRNGFSALWKDVPADKETKMNILTQLEYLHEKSAPDKLYLAFSRPVENAYSSSLRRGDLCIIYPSGMPDKKIYNSPLLKGTIKEISPEFVLISLRNKLLNKEIFNSGSRWSAEPDYIDSNTSRLLSSLYSFLSSSELKRNLILGLSKPRTEELEILFETEFGENQRLILSKMLCAKDYFLLQGPPGTGKTKIILREYIRIIYGSTEKSILALAYTNRAADEICSALKSISPELSFLRLGNKESSEHKDKLISQLAEDIPMQDLFKIVKSTRIFVATVASVIANQEIFDICEFDIAVIDEASQILEPQIIGILAKVGSFIMIGDEKQLPAIVVQDLKKGQNSNNLNSIQLTSAANSLFERLLRICKSNGWDDAFAILSAQGRMHSVLMEFPNKYFYNGQLNIAPSEVWQTGPIRRFSIGSLNGLERKLAGNRILFIDCPVEMYAKLNKREAGLVSKIVDTIKSCYGNEFNEETVGVITPFRLQCSEIYRILAPELRSVVTVDTVERFQGSQREVIIISFALNHKYLLNNIQSITEFNGISVDRKLNVALTRAREHIVLLGNSELLETSPIFKTLINYYKHKDSYTRYNELE